MPSDRMHPRIAELTDGLLAITDNPQERPTQDDRNRLMTIRNKIKNLRDEPDISLSESDERDRQYLYVVSTREANRQEDFFERNGNKWAA